MDIASLREESFNKTFRHFNYNENGLNALKITGKEQHAVRATFCYST